MSRAGPNNLIAFKEHTVFEKRVISRGLPLDWYRIPDWNQLNETQRNQLKKQYQCVDFSVKNAAENKLYLTNQQDFINLDHVALQWQILENNKIRQEGQIGQLLALPKKTAAVNLPFDWDAYKAQGYSFQFILVLKNDTTWAKKGQPIAWEEFAFQPSPQGLLLVKTNE